MQRETIEATVQAIEAARKGTPTTMLCFSQTVAKDIRYRAKRALRRIPGARQLVRTHVPPRNPGGATLYR